MLGDDIVYSKEPCLGQLIKEYNRTYSSVIGVQVVPDSETHRYGIIDPIKEVGRSFQVEKFVEKPPKGTAPSNLAIIGRYILTPEIFRFLEEKQIGTGGEIQLTDAIEKLNKIQRVYAYQFEGTRYDVGEQLGYIQTTIEFALKRKDLKEELILYLTDLVNGLKVRG